MNSFGYIFRLTDYGDTHGVALGGMVDGCPAGVSWDEALLQTMLSRRRASPALPHVTARVEQDSVRILSGVHEQKTTGAPIGFLVENTDVQPDREGLQALKPSHASFVYRQKYLAENNSYCGRASARQTLNRVVGGAIAMMFLKTRNIEIETYPLETIKDTREGDTAGAWVKGVIRHLPAGLGEPVYDKFHARLAYSMLSINAARAFEIGEGFAAARMSGSEYNDRQTADFRFLSNHDGGVQAGITNGQDVCFTVGFKPIPSLQMTQETISFKGASCTLKASSRNDSSVLPRVLPVIEAMTALVVADFLLLEHGHCC
ncbi:MAG: chorismate synthase [Bacteroidales bacterium]|nr:chorismate synthase [Bacteroidales bacterium]